MNFSKNYEASEARRMEEKSNDFCIFNSGNNYGGIPGCLHLRKNELRQYF